MTEEYCDLSDLPKTMCAHCNPKTADVAETVPDFRVDGSITARYDGRCGVCGEYTIREGETLYRVLYPGEKTIVWAGSCCVKDKAR